MTSPRPWRRAPAQPPRSNSAADVARVLPAALAWLALTGAVALLATVPRTLAQIAPRPSSRALPYPTPPPLQPPPPLRIGVAWEEDIPAERIRHLLVSGSVVVAGLADGRLRAHAARDGRELWRADGCDPATAPSLAGEHILCLDSGGSLLAFDSESGHAVKTSDLPETRHGSVPSGVIVLPDGRTSIRPAGSGRTFVLSDPLRSGPVLSAGCLWALTGDAGRARLARSCPARASRRASKARAATSDPFVSYGEFRDVRTTGDAFLLHAMSALGATSDATSGSERRSIGRIVRTIAVSRHPGSLELYRTPGGRRLWRRRFGTDVVSPPIAVRTTPGESSHRRPETILAAATLDGLMSGMQLMSGRLAWTARTAGRVSRPMALWRDRDDPGPDGMRILVSSDGSRRLQAFRAADGAPAGEMVFEPSSADVLAGPVCENEYGAESSSPPRCYVAWSPYAPAGSRLTALRLSSRAQARQDSPHATPAGD